MQTKSPSRKNGNDGHHDASRDSRSNSAPHRRARFSASTKGIRLRQDQIEWVNTEIEKDPEESWSRMVRAGIDLLKKQRAGLLQVLSVEAR